MIKKGKTVKIGDNYFRTPFNTAGYYVQDAGGATVAECRSNEIAKMLAEMLNEKLG